MSFIFVMGIMQWVIVGLSLVLGLITKKEKDTNISFVCFAIFRVEIVLSILYTVFVVLCYGMKYYIF